MKDFRETCKFGLDLLKKKSYLIGTVSCQMVKEAVAVECAHSQLDVIEHFASQLNGKSQIRCLEHKYKATVLKA